MWEFSMCERNLNLMKTLHVEVLTARHAKLSKNWFYHSQAGDNRVRAAIIIPTIIHNYDIILLKFIVIINNFSLRRCFSCRRMTSKSISSSCGATSDSMKWDRRIDYNILLLCLSQGLCTRWFKALFFGRGNFLKNAYILWFMTSLFNRSN